VIACLGGLVFVPRSILVIEDNQDLARLLRIHLHDLSFEVDLAFDGDSGLAKTEAKKYDLIILDLMLPGLDGLEICRLLRSKGAYVPILMLTSRSSELDRVLGLEMGADDYVTKPFSIRELLARVKAMFRRIDELKSEHQEGKLAIVKARNLVIDPEKRHVILKGETIDLTAKEFDLLYHFAQHPGKVFSRSQLLDVVWGYGHDGYEHTVNSHINRLRAKIEENPSEPKYILTVWGVGYKFADIED
jgi:DNA-binding response OmpR family regulator